MAKSKRAKVVHLTKTVKKGREAKSNLIERVRAATLQYSHIYLFRVCNMRNVFFKMLREKADGRFFIGKNKVMAVALGTDETSECIPGAAQVASRLRGNLGIYFTNEAPEQVQSLLEAQETLDYARTGNKADMTVVIEADPRGLCNIETGELLSATLEPQLRQAGLPTKLSGGSVLLTTDRYVICEEGQVLTADQARLLKAIGVKMASFQVYAIGHLFDGTFEEFPDPYADQALNNNTNLEGDVIGEMSD